MKVKFYKKEKLFQIELNQTDANDLILAINMAECEGIVNRASVLKTFLESLLNK